MIWVVAFGFAILIIVIQGVTDQLKRIARALDDIATWYVVERAEREEEAHRQS